MKSFKFYKNRIRTQLPQNLYNVALNSCEGGPLIVRIFGPLETVQGPPYLLGHLCKSRAGGNGGAGGAIATPIALKVR